MPAPPLVIARTPLRISFLGGGSDYPEYFTRRGGRVLAAAIDRHTLVTVGRLAPSFGYAYKVGYSRTEEVQEIDEIEHPVVRACLGTLDVPPGIHVQYVGELPAGAGLGAVSIWCSRKKAATATTSRIAAARPERSAGHCSTPRRRSKGIFVERA